MAVSTRFMMFCDTMPPMIGSASSRIRFPRGSDPRNPMLCKDFLDYWNSDRALAGAIPRMHGQPVEVSQESTVMAPLLLAPGQSTPGVALPLPGHEGGLTPERY